MACRLCNRELLAKFQICLARLRLKSGTVTFMKLSLLLWLFVALGSLTNQAMSEIYAPNEIPKDMIVTLERTACFGACPVYKLTITADGTVTFEGYENVAMKGIVKDRISEETLRQLLSEFEKVAYFSLRDTYDGSEDGCARHATDMPSAKTSIQINGRNKAVSHYLGCLMQGDEFRIYPQELVRLENKIDEIVESKRWIK